ncbi:MAG: hypothetical protein PHY27_06835 [Parabacteroides sp.]|nr:hypothetical protein [Parabacteroides sp.]
MKNLAFVTGLFLASISFTGCASILTKTTYPVAINSSPEGANVTITGKKGTMVYEGTTPAIVKLKSSNGFFSGENYMIDLKDYLFNVSIKLIPLLYGRKDAHLDNFIS